MDIIYAICLLSLSFSASLCLLCLAAWLARKIGKQPGTDQPAMGEREQLLTQQFAKNIARAVAEGVTDAKRSEQVGAGQNFWSKKS